MKKLLLLCACLCVFHAHAQQPVGHWSVIPKLGVSLAYLTSFDYADNLPLIQGQGEYSAKYKAGLTAGVEVMYQPLQALGASVGLMYAQQGVKYPDITVQLSEHEARGLTDLRMDMHYLNVPLMLHYYIAEGLAVKAGVQVGVHLSNKMKIETVNIDIDENGMKTYGDVTNDNVEWENVHQVDFSIPVGLSYEWENVIVDARYHFGLSEVFNDNVYHSKHSVFTITAGYKFNL